MLLPKQEMHLASIPKDIVMMNATIIIMNIMIAYIQFPPCGIRATKEKICPNA